MFQTPQTLTLIPKNGKEKLSRSSILEGLLHTPESIAFTLDVLLFSNMLSPFFAILSLVESPLLYSLLCLDFNI